MRTFQSNDSSGGKSLNGGYAVIFHTLIFTVVFMLMILGVVQPVLNNHAATKAFAYSKQAFLVAESAAQDARYRLENALAMGESETLVLSSGDASITVENILGGKRIVSTGESDAFQRIVEIFIEQGTGASFNYGMQSGNGGIHLKNSSSIRGNVFSNGPVTGANSNIVRGDVISAGPDGLADSVHATGTIYAHTIQDSVIDGDAHYQTISGTTVGGEEFPDSEDQATSTFAITDEMIEEWKTAAVDGGTYSGSCPYEINANTTIGPLKVPCDLTISGSPTVTIAGNVWVEGDVEVRNTATLKVDDSLSGKSVPIVVDDPADSSTKGTVTLQQSVTIEGAGDRSYVLFVSQNNSAESGGTVAAIDIQNQVSGDLLVYAAHGLIVLKNNVELKEVTAYRIEVENFAEVIYESGLANLLFTSGPGGGWVTTDWQEI